MKANQQEEGRLREYLLGDLSEDAKERLEKRLMTDDEDFQELLIEEDELVDDYVRDRLSAHDRLQFENHFLCTPERRGKLRFSATLREYLRAYWKTRSRHGDFSKTGRRLSSLWDWLLKLIPHPTPAWGAASAAVVLVVATGIWSALGYSRIQRQLDQFSAGREELRRQRDVLQLRLEAEIARGDEGPSPVDVTVEDEPVGPAGVASAAVPEVVPREPPVDSTVEDEGVSDVIVAAAPLRGEPIREATPVPPPRAVASLDPTTFTLTPGLLRGTGQSTRVRVSSDANLVALSLDIGLDEYPQYRAVLHEAAGDEIWAQSKLEARNEPTGAMVVLTLPSQLLATGDYYVTLDGVTDDGSTEGLGRYDFRVLRE